MAWKAAVEGAGRRGLRWVEEGADDRGERREYGCEVGLRGAARFADRTGVGHGRGHQRPLVRDGVCGAAGAGTAHAAAAAAAAGGAGHVGPVGQHGLHRLGVRDVNGSDDVCWKKKQPRSAINRHVYEGERKSAMGIIW